MRKRMLVAGSFLLVTILGAGELGARYLRIAPLPAVVQAAGLSPNSNPGFVLLPASEINSYIKFHLADPKVSVQSWQPSVADIEGLDDNLLQISSLKENEFKSTRHIDNPGEYFRQYLPIVPSGKKLIFVNAMCGGAGESSDEWRHHLIIVCDGGDCFWQVYYDPATKQFSNLMINGRA